MTAFNSRHLRLVRDPSQAPRPAEPCTLVSIADRKLRRMVSRVLRASGSQMLSCEGLAEVPRRLDGSRADLLIHDLNGSSGDPGQLDNALARIVEHPSAPSLVLLNAHLLDSGSSSLLSYSYGRNLIAKLSGPTSLNLHELLVTIRKLLDRDVFGPEKYVGWGALLHSERVQASLRKAEVIGRFTRFLEELEVEPRLCSGLETVADEFIMNALYNAPVADGARVNAHRSRREPVSLELHEAPSFEYCSDGRHLALSCRDPFGSLSAERAQECLARAMRAGSDQINWTAGGAGIGLYMVYKVVDQLVINIDPGRATEFIGVVDLTQGFRARAAQPRSINIFTVAE